MQGTTAAEFLFLSRLAPRWRHRLVAGDNTGILQRLPDAHRGLFSDREPWPLRPRQACDLSKTDCLHAGEQ